ncbi:MAG: hypothetical protein NTW86_32295 [Candidatus Sumerlaeota bacterium]|nr:hypothetical protein [Candidatus Sumerlaeota bacterium]
MKLVSARLAFAALACAPLLSGCQYFHSAGYEGSIDLGVESQLWREELAGKRIAIVVYTNAINDMPEKDEELHYPMSGPKSSSSMSLRPDAGKRRAFTILNALGKLTLGLTASPWNTLANGYGWNTQTTIDGYPLNLPTDQLNEALYAGSKVAFESLKAKVSRLDASQTDGMSLGYLARSNQNSADYLWAIRHTYQTLQDGMGNARYIGEVRGSLFDTHGLKRWIKYRRNIAGPPMVVGSWVKIDRGEGKDPWFRMQFDEKEVRKTLVQIAEQTRRDLTDWPNRNPTISAAQRPGVKPYDEEETERSGAGTAGAAKR